MLYQRTAKSGLQYVEALNQVLQSDVSFRQGMQRAGDFALWQRKTGSQSLTGRWIVRGVRA